MKTDFDAWLQKVDAAMQTLTGMCLSDLPDCCYRDWYDARLTPAAAARRAIRNANE
jgi:hypothetical protein